MKRLVITTALVLAPTVAHADQCQLLDAATVERVRAIVAHPYRYAELCEPCGDTVPQLPFTPRSIEVTDELLLDGKPRDLAYTYVQTGPTRYENLALLAGCPATDVSPSLRVESETDDGVLITADDRPVRPATIIVEPPRAEAPPPPASLPAPPPPAPTYYATTLVYSVPWLAVAALAGGLGFGLGIAATLLVLTLRRRRALEPRAAKLG